MTRLVLALAAVFGWAAYAHLSRRSETRALFGTRLDAYPFPTSAAVNGIDAADVASVRKWSAEFGCTDDQLRAAIRSVGAAPANVRAHLRRRR